MGLTQEELQLLGGVLIFLSLALLFCWCMGGNKRDGFELGPTMYGGWRNSDGFQSPQTLTRKQIYANMPDLNFDKPIVGLNGMTNPSRTMPVPSAMQGKVHHSTMRWNVDGFIATPSIDQNASSMNADASNGSSGLVIREDIQTPMPVMTVIDNMRDSSPTSVQMKLVRADPYSADYNRSSFRDVVTV